MRRISVTQPRPDCLTVRIGPDLHAMALWTLAFVVGVALVVAVDRSSPGGLALLLVQLALLPVIAVRWWRLGQRRERALVRANGRLALDGEPLEVARVELRVLKMPITNVPTGYALSLWVMTAAGPEDIPIGRFGTLLQASALSGQIEDFVQRANLKQTRHA